MNRIASILSAVSGRGPDRSRTRPRRLLVLAILATLIGGPAASAWASETTVPPAAESVRATPASARAPESDPTGQGTYASREAASRDLETFKGGEPVVIITSTTILIILIVLLILVV